MLPEVVAVHEPLGNVLEATDGADTRAVTVSTVNTCQPDQGLTSRPSVVWARHS